MNSRNQKYDRASSPQPGDRGTLPVLDLYLYIYLSALPQHLPSLSHTSCVSFLKFILRLITIVSSFACRYSPISERVCHM